MLIKSECQPLDKTRHKPAWNLFEQREPCKMAREICNAACPLNSTHRPVIVASCNMSGETDRQAGKQAGRQADGERRGGIHRGPTSSVLSQGDISPLTLWVNRRVWWHVHVPLHSHVLDASIKSRWQSQSWRQDIRTCWNHRACNYGEQSLSEQTHYMKDHQWKIRAKNA